MENVIVSAKVKIKEQHINEVFKQLSLLHKLTHENDEGCIQYDLHKDYNSGNTYVFIETWENQEYLNAHERKEHFLTFVKNVEGKIEDLEITKLEKLRI